MPKILISFCLILGIVIYYYKNHYVYYHGLVSDHFDGKRFFDPHSNYEKTFIDVIKWRMNSTFAKWPEKVPNINFDTPPERVSGNDLRVTYVGHVTFLIQIAGLNILTDPVWSDRASPFSFAGPKRVIDPGIKFEDLPPIDIVWISHNHYDHLDLATIDRLWEKHKPRIITPLGNDTIIRSHNPHIIVETGDWGDEIKINDRVSLAIDPMQHWSARGILDRNKALWGALTIQTEVGNVYFIGDSGYGDGRYFKQAKEKFGKFRLALIPMGAYSPRWFMSYAHMDPEDMLKAHNDLGAPHTVPSHFDVFKLTAEPYGEAEQKLNEAKTKMNSGENVKIMQVGEFWYVPE